MTVCQEHAVVVHETREWDTCELIPALSDVFLQWSHLLDCQQCSDGLSQSISYPSASHWANLWLPSGEIPLCLLWVQVGCAVTFLFAAPSRHLKIMQLAWARMWCLGGLEMGNLVFPHCGADHGSKGRWAVAVLQAVRRNGCRDKSSD